MREAKYNRSLTVAFEPEDIEEFKQITDEKKISMAQWVREAAKEKLMREKELIHE